ncbi:hypothetical protein ABPG74_000545 [Tetrahymena malaccensis]
MKQHNSQQQRFCQQEKKCAYLDELIYSLKIGSKEENSLAKILEYMKRASKIKQSDKNLLIIAGINGTGKTAFSAYISGLNLKVISECNREDQKCSLCYSEDIYQKNCAIRMSNNQQETLLTNFFNLDNETIIVDCPGLCDSRGVEVDLSNSYCLSKAICYSQNIKFLITLDGQSFKQQIQAQYKSLKATLEAIILFIQGTKIDFTKNVAILFTKTEKDEQFYKEKFNFLINQLMKQPDFNYQNLKHCDQNKIQQYLQQLLYVTIILFPLPKEKEIGKQFSRMHLQSILQKINEIQYYKKSNNEKFYFQLTNQSLETLDFIRDYSRTYYDLLNAYFFQPFFDLQPNASNYQPCIQILKKLKFFLGEIYDNLLSQFNFLKEKDIKLNFGVIDKYELSEGMLLLLKIYENQMKQNNKYIQKSQNLIDSCKQQINQLGNEVNKLSMEEKTKKCEQIKQQEEQEALKKQREYKQQSMLQSQMELLEYESDLKNKEKVLDNEIDEKDIYYSNQLQQIRKQNANSRVQDRLYITTKIRSQLSIPIFAFIGRLFGTIRELIGLTAGLAKKTIYSIL